LQVAPPSSRDKILDVAEALFARRGYAAVGMREVASAAGLSKSSLFHHFSGKPELYLEALVRVLRRFRERLDPVFDAPLDPVAKLDRAVDALIDALAEHPTTARLLLRSLFEEDEFPLEPGSQAEAVDGAIKEMLARVGDMLREGSERGAFRPVSVPHMLQSLIGLTIYHFASGELGEDVIGRPLLSAEAVRERKHEVRQLLHHGLTAPGVRPLEDES
jgi:AcrR family transcriptional regulator